MSSSGSRTLPPIAGALRRRWTAPAVARFLAQWIAVMGAFFLTGLAMRWAAQSGVPRAWLRLPWFVYHWVITNEPIGGGIWIAVGRPTLFHAALNVLYIPWTAVRLMLPAMAATAVWRESASGGALRRGGAGIGQLLRYGLIELFPLILIALVCSMALGVCRILDVTVFHSLAAGRGDRILLSSGLDWSALGLLMLTPVDLVLAAAFLLFVSAASTDRLNALLAGYALYFAVLPGTLFFLIVWSAPRGYWTAGSRTVPLLQTPFLLPAALLLLIACSAPLAARSIRKRAEA